MAELTFGNPSLAVATSNRRRKKKQKAKRKAANSTRGGSMAKKNKGKKNKNNKGGAKNKAKSNRGGKKAKRNKKGHFAKNKAKSNRGGKKNKSSKNQRRNQVRGFVAGAKALPKSLMAAAGPLVVGAGLFRVDDLFADRVTDLVGVEADSAAGKGVRASGLLLLGLVVDGVMGRKKAINWTWGEMIRNFGLMKILAETFEDHVEPALGIGEPAEIAAVEPIAELTAAEQLLGPASAPTGGTVQATSPAAVSGFRGVNGGYGRVGALVRTERPIFG